MPRDFAVPPTPYFSTTDDFKFAICNPLTPRVDYKARDTSPFRTVAPDAAELRQLKAGHLCSVMKQNVQQPRMQQTNAGMQSPPEQPAQASEAVGQEALHRRPVSGRPPRQQRDGGQSTAMPADTRS